MFRTRPVRINLALQGGGAHGAFTWGVLDRLLEERSIQIGTISATSAGAVNAAALVAGLVSGGRESAQQHLKDLWDGVDKASVPDLLRLNPFFYGLSKAPALAQMATLMSPYEFNPMGFDPLRKLLTGLIDFEAIRARSPVGLLIAATHVGTGRARLFRENELTVDMVLASACLPNLHHAVEIDGAAYWDGGFSANPDIVTLAEESKTGDTLIVQLSPLFKATLPTGAAEISSHVNQLTFSAPLQKDVEIILRARKQAPRRWPLFSRRKADRLASHRFHLIEAGRYTARLKPESKIKPEREIVSHLFHAGRTEANKWLDRHLGSVGYIDTADLEATYQNSEERWGQFEAEASSEPAAAQVASEPSVPQKEAAAS